MIEKIGFMQGRLSPIVNGKIQSFPWGTWKEEIVSAKSIGISIMEWTLDQERLYENPLMTSLGQKEIMEICKEYNSHRIKKLMYTNYIANIDLNHCSEKPHND